MICASLGRVNMKKQLTDSLSRTVSSYRRVGLVLIPLDRDAIFNAIVLDSLMRISPYFVYIYFRKLDSLRCFLLQSMGVASTRLM